MKMDKDNDAFKNAKPSEQAPGEGIRKLKTSNVFRTLNFELYVKPVSIIDNQEFNLMSGCLTTKFIITTKICSYDIY